MLDILRSSDDGFHILLVSMDLAGAAFVRPGASFATGGYHFEEVFSCPYIGSSNGLNMKRCDMIPLPMWDPLCNNTAA